MKLAKLWILTIASVGLLSLTGCPDDDSGPSPAPPNAVGVCPAGQYLVNGTCMVDTYGQHYRSQFEWGGKLIISNHGRYQDFLRDYGRFCDQHEGTLWDFTDYWQNDCESWDSLAYISVGLSGDIVDGHGVQGIVSLRSYLSNWMSNGGTYIDLPPVYGTFYNFNELQGFEMINPAGTFNVMNSTLKVSVVGRPADGQVAVHLFYNGTEIARATIYKQFYY